MTHNVESVTANRTVAISRLEQLNQQMQALNVEIGRMEDGADKARRTRYYNVLADEKKRRVAGIESMDDLIAKLQA
jgi:uncharacterized protein Yka (UPF0111/DUF47 family)